MTAQDVADLFRDLELRLIGSLKRNLRRHKRQEEQEGGQGGVPEQWEAWQSAKLRDLQRFRKENEQIVGAVSPAIDQGTKELIREQYGEGGSDGFFHMNDRRVKALLEEMENVQAQVEKAALRYMDDVYRRTVQGAALNMATGSMTMQQAVDMATKDFLAAGITCIQYRNGRRVNIASYAEMALRTAATRATLQGEAALREQLGIDTVLVSQYGACSDTCLPWQGLVYIDDVFQAHSGPHTPGGTYGVSRNGKQYPLLSVAVRAGLFHPNCRHTLTTWNEGVSRRPKPMDKAKIEATSRLESRQRYLERRVREAKRQAEGLLDPEAAKEAKRLVRRRQAELKEFVEAHGDVLRRDRWRERLDVPETVKPEAPSRISRNSEAEQLQMLNYAEDVTEEQRSSIEKELSVLPKAQREAAERQISRICVTDDPDKSGYNPKTKEILMSSKWRPGDVIHEYGHALERELDLWHNDRYRALRKEGLDLADLSQVVYDNSTFTGEVYYIRNRKFVSLYQGRIYFDRDGSIFKAKSMEINDSLLLEYFSEGYRAYYMKPDLLKQRDSDLFAYIGGLLDDKS